MIKCKTCGLENLDHVSTCVECGNSLIQDNSLNNEQKYTPPRAGKYNNFLLFFYKIRRNTGTLQIDRPVVDNEKTFSFNRLFLDLADFIGPVASIIPGLGHVTQKRFLRGFIFFALWVFLILSGVFFYGRITSNFCFGFAIAIHASAAFDCLPLSLLFFNTIQSRISMMVLLLVLSLIVYYGIFNIINDRVFGIWINVNRAEPVLAQGDFILIKIQDEYKRGDIVFFTTVGRRMSLGYDNNFYIQPGTYFDRVIGLPGEKIEIIKRKIFVNDKPLPDEFYPIIKKNIRDMTLTLKDKQYFVYDSMTPRQNQFPINLLLLHNTVNEDNIQGRAFMIYAPFSRMKFLQ